MRSSATRLLGLTLFFSVLVFFQLNLVSERIDFSFGQTTTKDFIEYWSAYKLFSLAENPYSFELMLKTQKAAGSSHDIPIMMWNPPWLLAILSPILRLPFSASASLWLLCNFLMLLFSAELIKQAFSIKAGPVLTYLPAFLFIPCLETINLGQLSILLLFASSLLVYGLEKRRVWLIAIALLLLSLKAQLFLIVLLVLAFASLRICYLRRAIYGSLMLLSALIISLEIKSSGVNLQWFQSIGNKSKLAPGIYDWKAATLSTWLRIYSPSLPKEVLWAPTLLVALVVFATMSLVLISKRRLSIELLKDYFPTLLSLSFLAAPYSWLFDQSIFLLVQTQVLLTARRENRSILLALVLLIHLGYVALRFVPEVSQHHYAFFPLAWLALSLLGLRQQKTYLQYEASGH